MPEDNFINILVAEDNDVSREMMTGILRTQGYKVYGAIDGESAIKVADDRQIDLALVDINMAPKGGLEFIKYIVSKGIDIPVVVVTADESSHILVEASSLGVARILHKPVEPEKLLQTVERILKRRGLNPQPLAVSSKETKFSPEELMHRAITLAEKNVKSKNGGPYAAVVADAQGKIMGEGTNGLAARVDPVAHAEVMAIRQAADRLGKPDLSDCILYCSGYPTAVGQAVIASVGIKTVYFALSMEDMGAGKKTSSTPDYKQISRDEALKMFKAGQKL